MRGWSLIVMALLAALVAGCSNGPNSTYEEIGERVNTRGFGHKYAQPEDSDELVLGPGDQIDVQIYNNPEISSTQPVRAEGVITAPFVGDVKVAGLTPTQIRDKLTILITPYLNDVSIQVVPLRIQSKRIYVYTTDRFGALQGRTTGLTGDLTLIDLMTGIGGFNQFSDPCHVQIIRGDPRRPTRLNINVVDMIKSGYTAGNIQLRADDIIFLPPTAFAKFAQVLTTVTLPLRVISQSISGASSTVFLATTGTLPRRGAGGAAGGF